MNFVSASTNSVKLNDYLGSVIALSYVGETTVDSVIDGTPTSSPAVRASMMAIVDGKGVKLGETLVFPKAIRETLISHKGDAVVGKYVKVEHSTKKDWAYYNLEELQPQWFDKAIALFSAATTASSQVDGDGAEDVAPF